MPNSFDSNITRPLMRAFLPAFESERILSKNVNTQLFAGKFNPTTGDKIDIKRPVDAISVRSTTGDVTGVTASPIITGKATATVQDYITVLMDYDEADEAIKMDGLDTFIKQYAQRAVTDLEVDYADFMMKNTGLVAGTVGTPVTIWDHVAEAGSVLKAHGIPSGPWFYSVNPFTQTSLASNQRSLGSGGTSGSLISEAHKQAIISANFAGFTEVLTATTLSTYTTDAEADRAGTLSATPDASYPTAKDTMTQVLAVAGLGAGSTVISAGETIEVVAAAGSADRLNLSTRKPIVNGAGAAILWTGTVTATVTLTAGAGNLVVAGPALSETAEDAAYNTVSQPLLSGDVINMLGAEDTTIQPNLFWHKDAFAIAFVPIKRLHSTDTFANTVDGVQLRISKGSDFDKNEQKIRIDLRPAYGVMNPFFAGQGFGTP